jgi:predicted kinase
MASMILVRGLPGSGKSTIAKNLIGFYQHIETDMFWMVDGEYKFDFTRLGEAHAWCLDKTRDMLVRGWSPVVSNTFTTIKELRPYFDLAKEFNISPQVITCQSSFKNVHNVPEETLAKMQARFAWDISELYVVP